MSLHAWLAGLWDGDGSRYVTLRRDGIQKDYFVNITTSSFLEIKKIIEVFHEVFGFPPYNVRADLRKERKHYTFKARVDSKRVFMWFNEEHLNKLSTKYPLEYLSGLFWAEGSLDMRFDDRYRRPKIKGLTISLKPDAYKKIASKHHRGTIERLEQTLKILKEKYPNLEYKVYVEKKGRDKGKRIFHIKSIWFINKIININPCNWRIFKWLYFDDSISLLEYVFAYTLDYRVFNWVLGRVLSRKKKHSYGCFDTWFFRRIIGIDPLALEEELARGRSVEKVKNVFHRLGIDDYSDVLGYARACYEEFVSEQETDKKKLLGCILENMYGGSMKAITKTSLLEIA